MTEYMQVLTTVDSTEELSGGPGESPRNRTPGLLTSGSTPQAG